MCITVISLQSLLLPQRHRVVEQDNKRAMHAASSTCCCLLVLTNSHTIGDTASFFVYAEMNVKHDTTRQPCGFSCPLASPLGPGTSAHDADNRVVDQCFSPRFPFLAIFVVFLGATLRKACFAGYFCHVKTSTLDFTTSHLGVWLGYTTLVERTFNFQLLFVFKKK